MASTNFWSWDYLSDLADNVYKGSLFVKVLGKLDRPDRAVREFVFVLADSLMNDPPSADDRFFLDCVLKAKSGEYILTNIISRPLILGHSEYEVTLQESYFSKYAQAAQSLQTMQQAMYKLASTPSDLQISFDPPKDRGTSIEPIVAFRDFKVKASEDGLRLASRNGAIWPPYAKFAAACKKGQEANIFAHDAPDAHCQCGIYAFTSADHQDMITQGDAIWGEIYLWGEVLVCESGYRAEFAYPKTIVISSDKQTRVLLRAAKELETYGVPVLRTSDRAPKQRVAEIYNQLVEDWIRKST